MKTIGVQLKMLRENRGMSLDELSSTLGFVSKQSLSAYEQDKTTCPIDVMKDILNALKGQLVVLNGEMIIDTIEEFERRKNLPNPVGQGTPGAFWLSKDEVNNEQVMQDISKGIVNAMDTLDKVFDVSMHTGGGFFVGYKTFVINGEECVVIFGNDLVMLGNKGIKNTYLTLEELLEIDKSEDEDLIAKHSPYEFENSCSLFEIMNEKEVVVEDLFLKLPKKTQKELVRYFNLLQKYINSDVFVDYSTLDDEENTMLIS